MKNYLRNTFAILIFFLSIGFFSEIASASELLWKTLYKEKIKEVYYEFEQTYDLKYRNVRPLRFYLIDFDGDGIPELVSQTEGEFSEEYIGHIFTVVDGNISKLNIPGVKHIMSDPQMYKHKETNERVFFSVDLKDGNIEENSRAAFGELYKKGNRLFFNEIRESAVKSVNDGYIWNYIDDHYVAMPEASGKYVLTTGAYDILSNELSTTFFRFKFEKLFLFRENFKTMNVSSIDKFLDGFSGSSAAQSKDPTELDYFAKGAAAFAEFTYDNIGQSVDIVWSGEKWRLNNTKTITEEGTDSFRYMVFKKGNDIIIAFRGMVIGENFNDVAGYFFRNENKVDRETGKVYNFESDNIQAKTLYKCIYGEDLSPYLENSSYNIYISGHSLGGYLSLMAYKYITEKSDVKANIVRVDTFNAVGLPESISGSIGNSSKIHNYQICCDVAKAFSEGFNLKWPSNTIVYDIHTPKGEKHSNNIATQSDAHNMNWFLGYYGNPLAYLVAKPTTATVYVDGIEIPFDAYLIGESNYFKLRDVAYVLNDKFNVTWDGQYITITKDQKYKQDGSEMKPKNKDEKYVRTPEPPLAVAFILSYLSASAVTSVQLSTYNIDGNNYVKLRDIAKLIGFNVDWRDGNIWIESNNPYTGD